MRNWPGTHAVNMHADSDLLSRPADPYTASFWNILSAPVAVYGAVGASVWWELNCCLNEHQVSGSPHLLHRTIPGLACPNMTGFGAGLGVCAGGHAREHTWVTLRQPIFVAPCAHSSTRCTHGPENLHAWLKSFARKAGKVSGRGVQGVSQNAKL